MILEISLNLEEQKYAPVFRRLKTSGAKIPNVATIRGEISNHLNGLAGTFPGSYSLAELEVRASRLRPEITQELKSAYLDV